MMHLDFVRMKRKDIRWGRAIRKKLGLQVAQDPHGHGVYGHWWTEIGDLSQDPNAAPDDRWHATRSYGWWPSGGIQGGLPAAWQACKESSTTAGGTTRTTTSRHRSSSTR